MPEQARKRSKAPDRRPARLRYWLGKHLQANKVKQLMRWGMTKMDAIDYWQQHRKGRMKTSFEKKTA
jgi:hypothetical protein